MRFKRKKEEELNLEIKELKKKKKGKKSKTKSKFDGKTRIYVIRARIYKLFLVNLIEEAKKKHHHATIDEINCNADVCRNY